MVEFEDEQELVASMVGHRIVRAEWADAHPHDDWTSHEYATVELDDGRVFRFGAWGHDAWGATVDVEKPASTD